MQKFCQNSKISNYVINVTYVDLFFDKNNMLIVLDILTTNTKKNGSAHTILCKIQQSDNLDLTR